MLKDILKNSVMTNYSLDSNIESLFTLRHNATGERPVKSVLENNFDLARGVKVIGSSD